MQFIYYRRNTIMKKLLFFFSLAFLIVIMNSFVFAVGDTIDTRMLVKENTYNSPSAGTGTLIIEFQLKCTTDSEIISTMTNTVELDEVLDAQFRDAGSFFAVVEVNSDFFVSPSTSYTPANRTIHYEFSSGSWPLSSAETWYSVAELTIRYSMIANTGTVNWTSNPADFDLSSSGGSVAGTRIPITSYGVDLGTLDIPLPVELVAFNAAENRNGVKLTWQTESETDLAGFNLWKSEDAETGFEKINSVLIKAAGSSTNPVAYTFDDNNVEEGKTWFYRLEQVDLDGSSSFISSVQVDVSKLPESVMLFQNFPNPFNPSTEIRYDIPEESFVLLSVYNVLGKQVRTLVNEIRPAGSHSVLWDGLDNKNLELSSGIYFYKLNAGTETHVFKMMKVE